MALEVIDESSQHHGHAGARPEGESHFRVRIVAEGFRDKSRLERHRMVNGTLAEELKERVHALAIEASAPSYSFSDLAATDAELRALLATAKLPLAGLGDRRRYLGIHDERGNLVAAGGFQPCGESALLCSIAVNPAWRGRGLGQAIVRKLLATARKTGARDVYLLTETATDFFAALGFQNILRDQVPAAIAVTSQFTGSVCASAQAMRTSLNP